MEGKPTMGGWREAIIKGRDRFTDVRHVRFDGVGRTFEALDVALGERVWIKEVPRSDSGNPEVVVHEYETFQRLAAAGAHVPRVHELFVGEHDIAFSLQRLEETPLNTLLAQSEPDLARLRSLLSQLVQAIDSVHRNGVIHCDINPAHVFNTSNHRLVLVGFEFAVSKLETWMHEDCVRGNPTYMAPEAIRGEPVTEATDFYAVGIMLFEALTGRRPFNGSRMFVSKMQEPAPLPSDVATGVPKDLNHLCAILLDRDPARRPCAAAILEALGDLGATGPVRSSSSH